MSTDQSNNMLGFPTSSMETPTSSMETMDFFHDFVTNIQDGSNNIYMRFLEDILQMPNNNLNSLLRTTLNETSPIKLVLSEDGEKEITPIEFDPETYPDFNCCSITLKDFAKGDIVSKLPCNHLFNTEAIFKWLKEEKAECPVCRFKLNSIEKKIDAPLIRGFGPPRMPRGRGAHLRRLMMQRHQREEEAELQEALLASLSDQYRIVD